MQWLKGARLLLVCATVITGIGFSGLLLTSKQPSERFSTDSSSLYPNISLVSQQAQLSVDYSRQEPIVPVAAAEGLDTRKVALGRQLFYDAQLSGDGTISCASCHARELGGADGRSHAVGIQGRSVPVNSPTVWNSSLNFRQFWDGRALSLVDQVDGPLLHPDEMGSNWPEVIAKLRQDSHYVQAFRQLYADGIQPAAVRDAIATYEQALVTPNSRFDQYLKGDDTALSNTEKAGYQHFKSYGCVACHQGMNMGGNMFQRLGVIEDFFIARGNVQPIDLGRMNISNRPRDRYVFKVPSLRNIALTAPYLHDGSVETLEDTVKIMTRYQLGRDIPSEHVTSIVEFLNTLTGETPEAA
ncbi:MAG: cytochrome-c peroxidase [Cyanobacteria bacterium J06649_4]